MGQYWLAVNLDKKEFVHPHTVGCGLKLWEQLAAHPGTGSALIILCAAQIAPRGGGDLAGESGVKVIGRWAGDRIALIGDYAEEDDLSGVNAKEVYELCSKGVYTNISRDVAAVIERELEGTYKGDGWRHFKFNEG